MEQTPTKEQLATAINTVRISVENIRGDLALVKRYFPEGEPGDTDLALAQGFLNEAFDYLTEALNLYNPE